MSVSKVITAVFEICKQNTDQKKNESVKLSKVLWTFLRVGAQDTVGWRKTKFPRKNKISKLGNCNIEEAAWMAISRISISQNSSSISTIFISLKSLNQNLKCKPINGFNVLVL